MISEENKIETAKNSIVCVYTPLHRYTATPLHLENEKVWLIRVN